MKHKFVLAPALILILVLQACSSSNLVKWSERASRYSADAARIVQGYVNDGSLPNGTPLVARLNQFSADAQTLADAFKNGSSNTIELAANLTTALDQIVLTDVNTALRV